MSIYPTSSLLHPYQMPYNVDHSASLNFSSNRFREIGQRALHVSTAPVRRPYVFLKGKLTTGSPRSKATWRGVVGLGTVYLTSLVAGLTPLRPENTQDSNLAAIGRLVAPTPLGNLVESLTFDKPDTPFLPKDYKHGLAGRLKTMTYTANDRRKLTAMIAPPKSNSNAYYVYCAGNDAGTKEAREKEEAFLSELLKKGKGLVIVNYRGYLPNPPEATIGKRVNQDMLDLTRELEQKGIQVAGTIGYSMGAGPASYIAAHLKKPMVAIAPVDNLGGAVEGLATNSDWNFQPFNQLAKIGERSYRPPNRTFKESAMDFPSEKRNRSPILVIRGKDDYLARNRNPFVTDRAKKTGQTLIGLEVPGNHDSVLTNSPTKLAELVNEHMRKYAQDNN